MQNFVHLHVHTQYSLLDGQASIARLVDKALKDGMPGIAVTDHGNMFGIKEFWNYVSKKNKAKHEQINSKRRWWLCLLSIATFLSIRQSWLSR